MNQLYSRRNFLKTASVLPLATVGVVGLESFSALANEPVRRVGGASVGNLTAAAGIPTLDGMGPSGGGAHARSERLIVQDLPRRAALLGALLEELSA